MIPNPHAIQLVEILAGSMTPTTLAAVIGDLIDNGQPNHHLQGLQDWAKGRFRRQLVCIVGDAEAEQLLDPTVYCDGCGRGTAKVGGNCDACGELIECDPR